jgi:hypothetical protein
MIAALIGEKVPRWFRMGRKSAAARGVHPAFDTGCSG